MSSYLVILMSEPRHIYIHTEAKGVGLMKRNIRRENYLSSNIGLSRFYITKSFIENNNKDPYCLFLFSK